MSQVFSAARLRRSASFQRLTGVIVATFDLMLAQLSRAWTNLQSAKTKSGRPWETGGLEVRIPTKAATYSNLIAATIPI